MHGFELSSIAPHSRTQVDGAATILNNAGYQSRKNDSEEYYIEN
jgi:hypothetical protein